ncbi:hypothetical protein QJQ45_004953 [Haematococcus lacustris]|nr:hypothetical protein QJQ45_004953 [Haematococcus lacustris]
MRPPTPAIGSTQVSRAKGNGVARGSPLQHPTLPHLTPPHPTLPHPIPPHPIPHCPTSPHTAPPCSRNEITLGPFLDVAAVHIFSFLPAMKEASESDTIAKKFQAIFKALLAAFLEFTVVLCQDCIWLQLTAPDVYSQDHLCQHMQRCHGYQEVAEKAAQQLANGELLRRRPRGVMEILNDMYNLQLAGPAMTAALTASAARAAAVHHNTAPGQLGPLPAAAGAAAGQHSPAPGQWGPRSAAAGAPAGAPAPGQHSPAPGQWGPGSAAAAGDELPYTAEQLQQQAPVTEAMKLYRKGRYGQPPLCELEKDPSWRKGRKDLARRVCEIKKLIRLSDWYLETQCSVAKSKQEALDQLCHATRGIGAWSSQLKWLEALQGQLQPPTSPTPLAAAGRLTGLLQAPTSPTPLAAAGRLTGLEQPPYSPTPLAAAGRLTGLLQPHYSPTPLAAAGRLTGQLQPPTSPTPLAAAGRLTGQLQPPTSPTPLAAAGRLTGQLQPPTSPTPLAAAGRLTGQLQPRTSPTPLAAAGRLTGQLQPPTSPTPLAAAGSGAGLLQAPTSPTPLAAAGSGAGLLQAPTSPTPLAAAGSGAGLLQPPTYPTPLAAAGSGAGLLQPPTSPTPLAAVGNGAGLLQPPTSPTPLAAVGNGAGLQLGLGCPMPCTVEQAVSAFLSHSAKNLKKTTGLMTGCNVFVCLAGAVGEKQPMALWPPCAKATKDVYKKAAATINQLQGRERKATRVATRKH